MKDAITGLEFTEAEMKEEYMVVNKERNLAYSIFPKRSLALSWILANQIKHDVELTIVSLS